MSKNTVKQEAVPANFVEWLKTREADSYSCGLLVRDALAMLAATPPDWVHLKEYGYAPGDYMCKCRTCGQTTSGLDKRAITCKPCAETLHAAGKRAQQMLAVWGQHGAVVRVISHGKDFRPDEHETGEWRDEDGVVLEFEDGYRDCFYVSSLLAAAPEKADWSHPIGLTLLNTAAAEQQEPVIKDAVKRSCPLCEESWYEFAEGAVAQAPNAQQVHPIDPTVAAELERSDWTPEEALRWYAAGKHYDTVPNGHGSSARILDNGAVASNALKNSSFEYARQKGDVALNARPAPEVSLELPRGSNHEVLIHFYKWTPAENKLHICVSVRNLPTPKG